MLKALARSTGELMGWICREKRSFFVYFQSGLANAVVRRIAVLSSRPVIAPVSRRFREQAQEAREFLDVIFVVAENAYFLHLTTQR